MAMEALLQQQRSNKSNVLKATSAHVRSEGYSTHSVSVYVCYSDFCHYAPHDTNRFFPVTT